MIVMILSMALVSTNDTYTYTYTYTSGLDTSILEDTRNDFEHSNAAVAGKDFPSIDIESVSISIEGI